jgi:anthranilate 1,2-dioxygenase small subunit
MVFGFVEDRHYDIIPKENFDAGLPKSRLFVAARGHAARPCAVAAQRQHCEDHTYRHATSTGD